MQTRKSCFLRIITYVLISIIYFTSCTNTRYLTDSKSIDRQHDMRSNRYRVNIGDVFVNIANFFISGVLNTGFEVSQSERAFKRITIVNESSDSLFVNMVTDMVWKESRVIAISWALHFHLKQGKSYWFPTLPLIMLTLEHHLPKKKNWKSGQMPTNRRFVLRAEMTNWIQEK